MSGKESDAMMELGTLHRERLEYLPRMPPLLRGAFNIRKGDITSAQHDAQEIRKVFPKLFGQPSIHIVQNRGDPVTVGEELKVGVVFAGGPAPGGHNVVCGLFDHLKERNVDSKVFGFLNGTSGLMSGTYIELFESSLARFRNQGGFHMLGSDRTKLETEADFERARKVAKELDLDGLVFIGGFDTNTNAMYAAENFKMHDVKTNVVSVPSTIDGDLRNQQLQTSIGFDTVTKVYAELIANLGYDAYSAKKSYHFCRLMGRHASHVALEVALQTRPNMCLLGEEVRRRRLTLAEITSEIADLICERAAVDKNYGVLVVPEGLIEFIPDVNDLLKELNELLAKGHNDRSTIVPELSESARATFSSLPNSIGTQLLFERDPHGNVQLSRIEVERLLIETVKKELGERKARGVYKGSFSAIPHYFGYEGRCALPTNFDCNYGYALGHTAGALLESSNSGYAVSVSDLTSAPEKWECGGYPLTMMMSIERRKGASGAVVNRSLVNLDGIAFKVFKEQRKNWRLTEDYRTSGPIQHFEQM
ncbi:hypothetical protein NDN08_001420 [Rhodosorus marinus]|uniref:Pyrophosphate--fructose 6-phosphate 1-phosphotransferase n=1 Tax=Rhodosorus marinus TaxID=101924 RepID=A0AAV8UTS9_9RHOD|nr:hypothetical protein NDN08_001420 [Rhodosorus marinus]